MQYLIFFTWLSFTNMASSQASFRIFDFRKAQPTQISRPTQAHETSELTLLKSLTAQHIAYIFNPHQPDSFQVLLGYPLHGQSYCTDRDFQSLEKELTLPFLHEHGLSLLVVAHMNRRKQEAQREARLIQLLKSWKRPNDEKVIQNIQSRLSDLEGPSPFTLAQKYETSSREIARALKTPVEALPNKIESLISKSPSCLSWMNLTFSDRIKTAVTEYRATQIIQQLKNVHGRTGQWPAFETLKLSDKDPLLSTMTDGWWHPFKIEIQNDQPTVLSKGASTVDSTDDLRIQ